MDRLIILILYSGTFFMVISKSVNLRFRLYRNPFITTTKQIAFLFAFSDKLTSQMFRLDEKKKMFEPQIKGFPDYTDFSW